MKRQCLLLLLGTSYCAMAIVPGGSEGEKEQVEAPEQEEHAIFDTIRYRNYEGLQDILENDSIDINNTYNENGFLPLTLATHLGDVTAVDILIENDVDVDQLDANGQTALHLAMLYNHFNIADFLQAQDASLEIKNKVGETPLTLAMRLLKNAGFLINDNINPENHVAPSGKNLLHFIVKYDVNTLTDMKNQKVLSPLLTKKDMHGNTPPHDAVLMFDLEAYNLLLMMAQNTMQDIEIPNDKGMKPNEIVQERMRKIFEGGSFGEEQYEQQHM